MELKARDGREGKTCPKDVGNVPQCMLLGEI